MEASSASKRDNTEGPSGLSTPISESGIATLPQRPKRADAARNYDKLIAAAREAFTEDGASASLEDIARRAGVGIGTLYRNFATRQELLEAAYVGEVEAICQGAVGMANHPPWEALTGWLREFVDFAATKRAISEELMPYLG